MGLISRVSSRTYRLNTKMGDLDISQSKVVVPNEPEIQGLNRTNKSYLNKFTHDLDHNKISTFEDALKYAIDYKKALESTDLFKNVNTEIKTNPNDINSDNVEIICSVVERNRTIDVGFDTGVSDSSPSSVKGTMNFKLLNLFGNGESLNFETDRDTTEAVQIKNLNWYLQNQIIDKSWINSKEKNNGVGLEIGLRGNENFSHSVHYEMTERHVRTNSNILAMRVRENLGHSLKSSVCYNYKFNGLKTTKSDKSKSKNGVTITGSIELAGLYGTSQFLKWNLQRTYYKTFENLILSLALKCGHIMGPNIEIQDRLYLGGPMDLRGYDLNEATPKEGCNKCLGLGLHAYLPITSQFDLHTFATTGSAFDELPQAKKNLKTSVGAGVSCDLSGIVGADVKIELNNIYKIEENKNRIQVGIG